MLLLPFLCVGTFQLIAPYLTGQEPFSGSTQVQLQWTYGWLAVAVISAVIVAVIYKITDETGWSHLRQMIGAT